MIECFKIEEFVICEMFYPYMSDLLPMDSRFLSYWQEEDRIEKRLWKEPEYIIKLLEEYPEVKRKVFERINKCGGVKFYRYLDMSCDIIQYVQSELPKYYVITADMVRQLREMTGAGMMDCKRAFEKNNNDINKAAEYLRENEWKHRVMI